MSKKKKQKQTENPRSPQNKGKQVKETYKNPHDRFVKKAFSHRQVALEMFDRYLPADLKPYAKVEEFEKVSETFVDHELDEDITDLLFKIPMDYGDQRGSAYVYELTEHQRKISYDMPVRELELKAKIARYHMNKYKTNKIPLIRVIVIYNGKLKYTGPRELWEMTDAPETIARENWAASFDLADVSKEPVLEMAVYMWMRSAFLLLKHIDDPGLLEMVTQIGYNLEQMARETGGPDYLKTMYAYTFQASKYIKPEQIGKVMREQIGGKAGDIAMTVADELIQQGLVKGLERGREEGREEGIELHTREIAFSMFSKNYDLDEVADIQKLSSKQVLKLKAEWDSHKS